MSPWLVGLMPGLLLRRAFTRTLLVLALAGLWPLLRSVQIRSLAELGYPRSSNWWKHLLGGIGLGVISFAIAGLILVLAGARTITGGHTGWLGAVAVGLVVGVLEETLFRGGIFGVLRRELALLPAMLLASMAYAVAHFLGGSPSVEPVTWSSGFRHLADCVATWSQPGLVTLTMLGCILVSAFHRTRALYLSIGLHAGWVMALKIFAKVTTSAVPEPWWASGALINSPVTWPVLLVVWWLICHPKLKPLA